MSISLLSRLSATCALLVSCVVGASGAAGFTEVRPDLYTGGQPDAAQLHTFAHDGGKVVIDLRGADEARGYDEAAVTGELGLRYVRLPIGGASGLTLQMRPHSLRRSKRRRARSCCTVRPAIASVRCSH